MAPGETVLEEIEGMRANVINKFGPPEVFRLKELEKPVPKDNEVLIKIRAATVSTADCELRGLHVPFWSWLPIRIWLGSRMPNLILGQELAGEVEAAGSAVNRFHPGDPVFGTAGLHFGTYAEYICLPERPAAGVLGPKPANMTYEEAAALSIGGPEALNILKGHIHSGQKVLIIGAGGSIGTIAVQLARHFGAEVTGVDSSGKLDMLRSLGADHVIDYTREKYTQSGETYDVIFDVIGKSSFSGSVRLLKQNGRYLLGNPGLSHRLQAQWTPLKNGQKVIFRADNQSTEDLVFLKELVEAGQLKTVIDQCYPLEQLAAAHRYVETGQKKGNVVITI
jgi:2-desacetyl-2-hydroxyethyl bacteriochlorophyllide A dehydrogenase